MARMFRLKKDRGTKLYQSIILSLICLLGQAESVLVPMGSEDSLSQLYTEEENSNSTFSTGVGSSGIASSSGTDRDSDTSELSTERHVSPFHKRRRINTWRGKPLRRGSQNSLSTNSNSSGQGVNHPLPLIGNSPWSESRYDGYEDLHTEESEVISDGTTESQRRRHEYDIDVYGLRTPQQQAVENEAKRLCEVLQIMETGKLSEARIAAILQTDVMKSTFSYQVLMKYMEKRSRVVKRSLIMCASEHAAAEHDETGSICKAAGCTLPVQGAHKYWYRHVSDLLLALCREQKPFEQFMNTCETAQQAVSEKEANDLFDFYDGDLFRELYGTMLEDWDQENEIFVFLSLSSDGFEEFAGRTGSRTSWPIICTILSYAPEHRFRARNTLLSAFIPGTHSADQFDSFLSPVIEDLLTLQDGVDAICPDLKTRKLRAFVLFATFDTPGASKCVGFLGHSATLFCRCCHKATTRISGGRYVVPSGTKQVRLKEYGGGSVDPESLFQWLDLETPGIRTDGEIREVWDMLEGMIEDRTVCHREMAKIRKESGISRKPVLGRLNIDVARAIPFDPMHLLYLGWVKLLVRLLFGLHPKTSSSTTFVLSVTQKMRANKALSDGFRGIPGSWGRPPSSIENSSGFRAIDYKYFGLYYGPIIFCGRTAKKKVAKLWNCTWKIISIASDATPKASDCAHLRSLVQEAHKCFADVFFLDSEHGFCFTPTTHYILHLPDILANCGPLPNVSQWLVERVIGEVGERIGSRVRPEANLFHKTQKLFSLQLINGGLEVASKLLQESENSGCGNQYEDEFFESFQKEHFEVEDGYCQFPSKGSDVEDVRLRNEIIGFIKDASTETLDSVEIVRLFSSNCAKITQANGVSVEVETQDHYGEREKVASNRARQKFWVAATFAERDQTSSAVPALQIERTYFGRVIRIWKVFVSYRKIDDQNRYGRIFNIAQFGWQYGMVRDAITGVPSVKLGKGPRRGSIRHYAKSIENLSCIKYLIGFFDYEGRRYFLDPDTRSNGYEVERLGGIR